VILSIFLGYSLHSNASFLEKEYPLRVEDAQSRSRHIFAQIIKSAKEKKWESLPIGECIGNIGLLMVGTEYVAGTIEGEGPEICRVDLTGLDCVTFYENVLCTARILKKGKTTYDDLIAELTLTRYRGGKLTDYTSRLHYTSDWIYDNEKKKVVRNITRKIGGKEYPVEVSFMSKNPGYYPALKEFPEFIKTIATFEKEINKHRHWYIPKRKVKKAQRHIRTGDIIVLATNKEGLDYAHTGLAYRDEKGKVRFLHASSEKKKVMLDTELYKYIQSVETFIGITVARPQEVRYP
jgi:hypothetical protein